MLSHQQARDLVGKQLWAEQGVRVGIIGQVFLDDRTQQPEWITVHTGLFGSKEKFVPLAQASLHETGLSVPYPEQTIKRAPTIDVEAGTLTREEEACLYEHYQLSYEVATSASLPRQVMPAVTAAQGTPGVAQPAPEQAPTPVGVGASPSRTAEGAHPLTRRERVHPILARGVAMGRAQRLRRAAASRTVTGSGTARGEQQPGAMPPTAESDPTS